MSDHDQPVAPNLLARRFDAEGPNQRWVGDTTELRVGESGRVFLAAVLDLYSRFIVGWALSAVNDRQLVIRALPDGRVLFVGGGHELGEDPRAEVDVYDPKTNSWKPAAPLPTPRSGVAAVLYRNRILVFGGECNSGHPFIENEAYDVETGRWSSLAPMPSGRPSVKASSC